VIGLLPRGGPCGNVGGGGKKDGHAGLGTKEGIRLLARDLGEGGGKRSPEPEGKRPRVKEKKGGASC